LERADKEKEVRQEMGKTQSILFRPGCVVAQVHEGRRVVYYLFNRNRGRKIVRRWSDQKQKLVLHSRLGGSTESFAHTFQGPKERQGGSTTDFYHNT